MAIIKHKSVLVVLLVLFAGIVFAGSQSLPTEPSRKFEYLVLREAMIGSEMEVKTLLDSYGSEGWELCGVTGTEWSKTVFYLKRPVR